MNLRHLLLLVPLLAANAAGLALLTWQARQPVVASPRPAAPNEAPPPATSLPPPPAAAAPSLVIAERSLFLPMRHAEPPPPPPVAAIAATSVPPVSASMVLLGTVGGPGNRIALLKRTGGSELTRLREGQNVAGWDVAEIGPNHVTFQLGERRDELRLTLVQGGGTSSPGLLRGNPELPFLPSPIPTLPPPRGTAR